MSSEPIIPSEVSALLAAVDALPDAAKSAALMHINSRLQARLSESLQVPTLPKAHSCHICTRFVLHMSHWPTPMSDVSNADSDVIDFTSEKIVLTKETLRQGLTQRCTLIEWIYSELARDLRSVESELAQHVRDVQLTAQGTTDHLFYISGNGVSAEFSSSQEFDEMAICLRYEVEPFLVDRLWDRGIDLRRGRSYELFEGDYNAIAEITFRLSAAPGTSPSHQVRRLTDWLR